MQLSKIAYETAFPAPTNPDLKRLVALLASIFLVIEKSVVPLPISIVKHLSPGARPITFILSKKEASLSEQHAT